MNEDGSVPVYVVVDANGDVAAVFDCLESAQLYANSTYGPWFPESEWEVVMTSVAGRVKMIRTLHDEGSPELGCEGADIAILSIPGFFGP